MEEAQNIFDATKLLASGGFAITLIIQIVKMATEGALTARATVVTASIAGGVLTGLFVAGAGGISITSSFDIVIAWVTLVAIGAGIHRLATATATGT